MDLWDVNRKESHENGLASLTSGKVEQLSPETGPLAGCDVITESLGFGKGCREEIL